MSDKIRNFSEKKKDFIALSRLITPSPISTP